MRLSSSSSCVLRSELQAALAGAVSQGRDATGVLVAGAVEDHALDAGGLRALGDELTDGLRLVGLRTGAGAQVRLEGGGRDEGLAEGVVDDLGDHVPGRLGDDQARTLGRAVDLLAAADLALEARLDLGSGVLVVGQRDGHRHLPAFPTLRRTFSPA